MARRLSELRKQLRDDVLSAYEQEHTRLVETWNSLESKAQATVAIAGIFIGGMLALAKDITPETGFLARIIILVPTIILLATVLCAALALTIQTVEDAPEGDNVRAFVDDLLAVDTAEELSERMPRYLGDRSKIWSATNSEHFAANEQKAGWIQRAQWLLFAAIVTAALVVGWQLFIPTPKSSAVTSANGGTQNELPKVGVQREGGSGEQLLPHPPAGINRDSSRPKADR